MSLQVGERLGDYEVVGTLGMGGMGAVYRVRHLISDRIEALKILLPDLAATPELGERFMREIRLQGSLNHPNIAALHNALRVENQLLMVMEFVDGQNLAELVRSRPPSVVRALQIMAEVLSALDYAHSRGVVHRDVKPSNIIVTNQQVVKLMDFGIAREMSGFGSLTQAGAAIGSMYYMAPEQITGDHVDGRADVYAAAATLYEIITGQRAIRGSTAAEILHAQLNVPPVHPKLLNPLIPDDLGAILLRALEKDPSHRYASAAEFRDELQRVAATLSDSVPTLTFQSGPQSPDRVRTPTPGGGFPAHTTSQAMSFDPLGLERLRKDLAQHIGPVAKLLVDRAAKRSRNWRELYSALAQEVPAGKDRDKFLEGCPR